MPASTTGGWHRRGSAIASPPAPTPRTDRHSGDGAPKMVVFRAPVRSGLKVRENRKLGEPPLAGRQSWMSIGPRLDPRAARVVVRGPDRSNRQIGSESCRARVGQAVWLLVVA